MRVTAGSAAAPAARYRNSRRGSFMVVPRELERLPRHTINNIHQWPECLLLAQSGHFAAESQCPLLGVKRTSYARALECAPDGGQFQAAVLTGCWACRSSYCTGLK